MIDLDEVVQGLEAVLRRALGERSILVLQLRGGAASGDAIGEGGEDGEEEGVLVTRRPGGPRYKLADDLRGARGPLGLGKDQEVASSGVSGAIGQALAGA